MSNINRKYTGFGLSREGVKLLAVLLMTLNHFAYVYLPEGRPLTCFFQYAGYFTMVTMCAILTEGFEHTSSKMRYALRLAFFAMLSQLPFKMMMDYPVYSSAEGFHGLNGLRNYYFASPEVFVRRVVLTNWNAIYSLLICFALLWVLHNRFRLKYWIGFAALLGVFSLIGDWPGFAFAYTLLFYKSFHNGFESDSFKMRIGQGSLRRAYLTIAIVVGVAEFAGLLDMGTFPAAALLRGCAAAGGILLSMLVMTMLYTGKASAKKGKAAAFLSKWFFYVYYPAHILILVLFAVM